MDSHLATFYLRVKINPHESRHRGRPAGQQMLFVPTQSQVLGEGTQEPQAANLTAVGIHSRLRQTSRVLECRQEQCTYREINMHQNII